MSGWLVTPSGNWMVKWIGKGQADFEQIQKESLSQTDTNETLISNTRQPLIDNVRNLLTMTDLLYESTGDETLGSTLISLNELIDITMTTVRATATRRENDKNANENTEMEK